MRPINETVVVTTNLRENSPFEVHNWVIAGKCDEKVDHERVGVYFRGKEYSLVLDELVPRLEVWDGMNREKVFDLTEPGNTHYEEENELNLPMLTDNEGFLYGAGEIAEEDDIFSEDLPGEWEEDKDI